MTLSERLSNLELALLHLNKAQDIYPIFDEEIASLREEAETLRKLLRDKE